jgi:RNA-binding protein
MKWASNLTGKQVRVLRGLGHHLSPKVMIGRQGITDNIIASAEAVLVIDELIKIKLSGNCEIDRQQAAVVRL